MGTYTKSKATPAVKQTPAGMLTEAQFVLQAITTLRKGEWKGIHSVYTGFNTAFATYFGKNPVDATTKLQAEGVIEIRPVKGGVLLYKKGDAPAPRDTTADRAKKTLAEMGL